MINILLNGCNGKMGQVISGLTKNNNINIVAGIDLNPEKIANHYKVYKNVEEVKEKANLLLDFSHPSSLPSIVKYCKEKNIGLIVASTGLSNDDYDLLKQVSLNIPLFQSANMSLGVNLVANLCRIATKALSKDFEIEIIEKHHKEKIDAPSGTALMIADEINKASHETMDYIYNRRGSGKRKANEIGIYAVRGGTIPGEHTIIFAGKDEVIELKHSALSRKIFAEGALKAVKFLSNKPSGYYNMDDLIHELT